MARKRNSGALRRLMRRKLRHALRDAASVGRPALRPRAGHSERARVYVPPWYFGRVYPARRPLEYFDPVRGKWQSDSPAR